MARENETSKHLFLYTVVCGPSQESQGQFVTWAPAALEYNCSPPWGPVQGSPQQECYVYLYSMAGHRKLDENLTV